MLIFFTTAELRVDFEATTYNTSENDATVEVCAVLVSGNITGISFVVGFSTSPDSALGGKLLKRCNATLILIT